jgi:hypothetical protein
MLAPQFTSWKCKYAVLYIVPVPSVSRHAGGREILHCYDEVIRRGNVAATYLIVADDRPENRSEYRPDFKEFIHCSNGNHGESGGPIESPVSGSMYSFPRKRRSGSYTTGMLATQLTSWKCRYAVLYIVPVPSVSVAETVT